jgi:hypothetical protein
LGSRHLQGVLKDKFTEEVWIIDEWRSSLELAFQRSREISHNATLHFQEDFTNLPIEADLCIISGTANVRLSCCQEVLSRTKIKFLVLEKILFNSLPDFQRAEKLLKKFPAMKIWVNHARRMFPFYGEVKEQLQVLKSNQLFVEVSGSEWGLACNALHFIDLWCFLRETELSGVDFNHASNSIIESKRSAFIEVKGLVKAQFSNGDEMSLLSEISKDYIPISMKIKGENCEFVIYEYEHFYFKDLFTNSTIVEGRMELQSDLSNLLVSHIRNGKEVLLTPIVDSLPMHSLFIASAVDWYNSVLKKRDLFIPIT